MTDDPFQEALAFYNAGNYRRCFELVTGGLSQQPDNPGLLDLAGKCSLALNRDDAATYFQRVVNLQPDNVEAWHSLGDALVDEGNLEEAAAAFREAVRLRPT